MLQGLGMFSRSIHFKSFFAVEMLYMLEKALKLRGVTNAQKNIVRKIIENINEHTWIKDTLDPVQVPLNYKALDVLDTKLLDSQFGFLEHWSWHRSKTKMRGMLLHADPGTGKTISGYGWALVNGYDTTIIVSPHNAVVNVWEETITRFFKEKPKYWHSLMSKPMVGDEQFIIVHYHYLGKLYNQLRAIKGKRIGVWLDESHNLNETISKRTALFNDICSDSRVDGVVWASGTPLKAIGRETLPLFRSIDPLFTEDVELIFKKIFGSSNQSVLDILRHRLGMVTHRIVKDDVVSVDVSEETIRIKVPNSDRFTLDYIKRDMMQYVNDRIAYYRKAMPEYMSKYLDLCDRYEKDNSLQANGEWKTYCAYARQMHDNFNQLADIDLIRYCSKYERDVMRPRLSNADKKILDSTAAVYKYVILVVRGEALGRILTRARIDCFKAMVPHAGLPELIEGSRKKTIIFTSYVEVVDEIYDYLVAEGYEPLKVYGETVGELERIMKVFKVDPNANPIIATYNSLSTAVPVTDASTVVAYNCPFRQYIYDQATSRVNRLGQDGPVDIYKIILDTGDKDNISSRSLDLQDWSREIVDALLGNKTYTVTGEDIEVEGVVSNLLGNLEWK